MERPLDIAQWPDIKLAERFLELQDLAKIPHTPERRKEIEHELAGCAFELLMRKRDRELLEDD